MLNYAFAPGDCVWIARQLEPVKRFKYLAVQEMNVLPVVDIHFQAGFPDNGFRNDPTGSEQRLLNVVKKFKILQAENNLGQHGAEGLISFILLPLRRQPETWDKISAAPRLGMTPQSGRNQFKRVHSAPAFQDSNFARSLLHNSFHL